MNLPEIPKGFKALLPEEAKRRNFLIEKIAKIVELWGYDRVVPPTIEFLSTFKTVDEKLENLSFKLVDRFSGRLMAVRPDFTPQVSRIVASSFKEELPPFRFYYFGRVFRDGEEEREIFQFGFELIGVKETEADAEIVSIVANILNELGLKSFQIDIGHTEFFEGAVEELGLEDEKELIEILSHKDFSGLELFCDREKISKEKKEKLKQLIELYGGEEVLNEAEKIFKGHRAKRALKQLKEMFQILKSYGFERQVIFDLSERRGLKYHSGITFEVFHPLYGFSIGGGGRYDSLTKKFGRELPATGLALNVDALQQLLEKKKLFPKEEGKDFYLIDLKKELHLAYKLAKELRKLGYSVSRDIVKRDYKISVETAFKKGFKWVIVLNRREEPKNVLLTRGEKRPLELPESVNEIANVLKKLFTEES